MKKLLYLILLLFISCGFESGMDKRDKQIYLMVKDFAALQTSKGLSFSGFGQGVNHETGKHILIEVIFSIDQFKNIKEARKTLVSTIIEFLDFINSRESVQPYIDVNPFTLKNVEVAIDVRESKPGEIAFIFNCENQLCYFASDPDPNVLKAVKLHEETFEEAVEILKKEGANPEQQEKYAESPLM